MSVQEKHGWRRFIAKPGMKWGGIGAGAAIILGGVFWFGIAVGNGTISFSDLSNENASLPTTLDYSSVTQVYNSLRSNYDGKLDTTKLLDGMKAGLVQAA